METLTSPGADQLHGVDVRWPITLITAQGRIDGETQTITPRGMLISCLQPPPMEGSFEVLVKVPGHKTLRAIAKSIWTDIASVDNGAVRLGIEIEFSSIADSDRQFLQGIIARDRQPETLAGTAGIPPSPPLRQSGSEAKDGAVRGVRVEIPVSYNQGGKSVQACVTRLSTRGCLISSKKRPPAGSVFSLKLHNPLTGNLIQLDSWIIQCQHLPEGKHWGTMLRFMHLSAEQREEIRKIMEKAVDQGADKESRHRKTGIGQVIQRYFSWRK
jgi:PilZ domain